MNVPSSPLHSPSVASRQRDLARMQRLQDSVLRLRPARAVGVVSSAGHVARPAALRARGPVSSRRLERSACQGWPLPLGIPLRARSGASRPGACVCVLAINPISQTGTA